MFDLLKWKPYSERVVANDRNYGYEIDTVLANSTQKYETGIKKIGYAWIIVEEYKTKEEAKIGHKKWVEFVKERPKKLFDVHLCKNISTKRRVGAL